MIRQTRPGELIDILRTDFQHRNEPNFAWKSGASVLQMIPGLIAAWPMSIARRDSGNDMIRDISGGGYHMTVTNGQAMNYSGLVPYVEFDGTNQYISRADGGAADWSDVRGTEGHVAAAVRGLTFGGWFWFDDPAGALEGIMVKRSGAAGNYAYALWRTVGGTIRCEISDDGTATDLATTTAAPAQSAWHCIIGRFDPSAFVEVFVDGTWTQQATARASIFDSNADLTIGAFSGPGSYMDGRASHDFLSQMYVSDAIIFNFFQQTRAMFGV